MAVWVLLWVVVLVSLYTDLKKRKIYNKTVLPGIVLGLALNAWEGGTAGLLFGVKGLLVGLGLLFLPFLLGGIGAGDVKLLGAVGAIMGPGFVVLAGLGTGVAGGLIAAVILIRQGRLLSSLKRIVFSVYLLFAGNKSNSLGMVDKREYAGAFPYGGAIALGVLAATVYRLWPVQG